MLPALAMLMGCASVPPQPSAPPPAAQNPSPMVEETRTHERISRREIAGVRNTLTGPAGKAVELLIPEGARDTVDVVIHFHGAAWLPQQAVADLGDLTVSAVVKLLRALGLRRTPVLRWRPRGMLRQ